MKDYYYHRIISGSLYNHKREGGGINGGRKAPKDFDRSCKLPLLAAGPERREEGGSV
jgi:hypothetical protein